MTIAFVRSAPWLTSLVDLRVVFKIRLLGCVVRSAHEPTVIACRVNPI